MSLSRRDALKGLGATVGATAIGSLGCGAPVGEDPADDRPDAAPPDAPAPDAPTPDALLASIDTFVVLMMENRSFDHYLGALALHEGYGCDGLTGTESNPKPFGGTVAIHPLTAFTSADPPHGWNACHEQWNSGANDGFVRAHLGPWQDEVMGYYQRAQLPVTYALVDQGALCERWFASVMGPTWPNRFYLHGATSNGITANLPALGFRSIFAELDAAGISHKNYFHDVAWAIGGYGKLAGNAPIEQFFTDAAAGTLPAYALIDPMYFGAGNDDHPSKDVRNGQALIASVVRALGASPQWRRCLLVITYDEHGGFFDHVAPPTTVDARAEFRQLGFRVPSVVVGPTARRGQIVRATFEHVSVIATLTRRFGLTPLNPRVATAADLSACLDPRWLTDPQPAPVVPAMRLSRAALGPPPAADPHPELAAILDAMALPPHLDRRARTAAVTEAFLRHAERLGAIELID